MAATTTQFHPLRFPGEGYLKAVGATSTDVFHVSSAHTLCGFIGRSTLMITPAGLFTAARTTAGDCIQIPVDDKASNLAFMLIFDGCSSDMWPCMAIRYPYGSTWGPAWMQTHVSTGAVGMALPGGRSSAADSGWKLISTTASHFASTTQAAAYLAGPFPTAKYGITAATSTDLIDIYQKYFEVQLGMTTAKPEMGTSTGVSYGAGIHWSTFSTTQMGGTNFGSTASAIFLSAFEIPSSF